MQSIDSPKYRGQNLLATWKQGSPITGLEAGDWTHCDIRDQECIQFRAIYRDLQYLAAPDCLLTESIFAHSNLGHADFQRSRLHGSNFIACSAEQARFNAIQSLSSRFDHARLRSASFQRAHLQQSAFRFANLHHANFTQADLRGVDFRAANLQQTKITGASLQGAIINEQTIQNSQWKQQTRKDWLTAGASWSEEMVTPTRFMPGIDIQGRQHTPFDIADALIQISPQFDHLIVVGAPPALFLGCFDHPVEDLMAHIRTIATQTAPPENIEVRKWEPVHTWFRKGLQLFLWQEQHNLIQCTQHLQF